MTVKLSEVGDVGEYSRAVAEHRPAREVPGFVPMTPAREALRRPNGLAVKDVSQTQLAGLGELVQVVT